MTAWRGARTVERLRRITPLAEAAGDAEGSVTIVVPARDEAPRISACVDALRAQTGPDVRIVVVDDASSDGTGEIVARHADDDPRVMVVRGGGPPPGWSGKVAAMQTGLDADRDARGRCGIAPPEWLLFVDADTLLAPDLLGRLRATAVQHGADLVSAAGTSPADGSAPAWSLLMPTGIVFIGEHADPQGRARRAFAIGQCLLVRRERFAAVGGWVALRDRRTEDVLLATRVRDAGGRTRLVDAHGLVTTSGLDPFGAGWASFRKTLVAATERSVPVLIGGGLTHTAMSLAGPVGVVCGLRYRRSTPAPGRSGRGRATALVAAGLLGWGGAAAAHHRAARLMRTRTALAPLAPMIWALFGAVLLDGARVVLRGTAGWKGRDQ
ncbi:glycosyltransferase family 2 protein [Pseudonocardia parietis]|uniref:GT2 family glycosyltransferase n=1 Tax=Pseudonocardia parietis TaxID=570936 RepID=A0ABS4VWJ6_9PSEU|nr:glycosyltransferase family 2 protein [Pseudonocardia parietis]MBP2367884.1 GT2 family glycosyltransferase [Pseudonocardia parietis]